MKTKKTMENTDNSRVYKLVIRGLLFCPICKPNKGCNGDRYRITKTWKEYRKNQWKD